MEKVANVSSIVVDVGELCRTHDLREEDLPTGFRAILETLCRCVLQRFHYVSQQSYLKQVTSMRLRARSESAKI